MTLKQVAVSFAWFIGFTIATNLVLRPMIRQFNVPLLKDVL